MHASLSICEFRNNIAAAGAGGAWYWLESSTLFVPPCTLSGNSALVGNDLASAPKSLLFSTPSIVGFPGLPLPTTQVLMLDAYSQHLTSVNNVILSDTLSRPFLAPFIRGTVNLTYALARAPGSYAAFSVVNYLPPFFINITLLHCPPGMALDKEANTCRLCVPGKFATTTINQSCVLCPAGRSQSLSGQSSCALCRTGTFSDVAGVTSCPACAYQTVSGFDGATTCKVCAARMECSGGRMSHNAASGFRRCH